MKQRIGSDSFHVLTVGWSHELIVPVCNEIVAKGTHRMSHIVHPKYSYSTWPQDPPQCGVFFLRDRQDAVMPPPDRELLAALERDDLPSVHNMILGDRVVSKLPYEEALGYATFLARRLGDLYQRIRPSVIITGFDAIHSGIALAVARKLDIPAFAINFSVIPPGMASLCTNMNPGSRVVLSHRSVTELKLIAESSLQKFERKQITVRAYVAPPAQSALKRITRLPSRASAIYRTVKKSKLRPSLRFTEQRGGYDVSAAFAHLWRASRARKAIARCTTINAPPDTPFVLFGFHMQPESSIDVWAPFYSNQMWVVELLSRSIPPSHKLLVKIHKSDVSNYSRAQLKRIQSFPGVELVAPFADSRDFIERASLLISIQGTMGLEAALIGKAVIMLGNSPIIVFPSVSLIGTLADLPALVHKKLRESPPSRSEIVDAYAELLAPFFPASDNNWQAPKTEGEILGYVKMFDALKEFLTDNMPPVSDCANAGTTS